MGISVLLLTLSEAANLPACLAPAVADDVHGQLAALFRALSQLSGAVGASRPLSLQAGRPGQREDLAPERIGTLTEPYLHDSFAKGLTEWVEQHNRYASAEAREACRSAEGSFCETKPFSRWAGGLRNPLDQLRLWPQYY